MQKDWVNKFLKTNKENDYNLIYDQLVSYGEILSSIIISKYLDSIGLKSKWIDARSCIITDEYYRDANVDFEKTSKAIKRNIKDNDKYQSSINYMVFINRIKNQSSYYDRI